MKRLLLAAVLSLMAFDAFAVNRYQTTGMSCASVQAALQRDGRAILSYGAPDNPSLQRYDRYVKDNSMCGPGSIAQRFSVPAADTKSCRVAKCVRSGSEK